MTQVSDEGAVVELTRGPGCDNCGMCSPERDGKQLLETDNLVTVKPGDKVIVEVAPGTVIKASFIIYMVPLGCLLGGIVFGEWLSRMLAVPEKGDLLGLICGMAALTASLLLLKLYDRRLARTGGPKARIIRRLASAKARDNDAGSGFLQER